jgi:alpha-L-fucosidase
MKIAFAVATILFCFGLSHGTSVDSVTVDSVWNSDSSWYDSNGVLQLRPARDCFISFISQASVYASCTLLVSLDSGKTWGASPNPLNALDKSLERPIPCGKKKQIKVRMYGSDRSNVVFKIVSSACNPEDSLAVLQEAYTNMKFGMFVYFNMSTFDRCCCATCISTSGEWGLANTPENEFQPGKLNCGQWADVAKSAGCKYVILTSKHHDGFCLWDSKFTTHDVASSSWRNGTGDVIKEFTDSARVRGLKVGLYYSIRDITNGYSLDFIKGQLTELLSNYGEITALWFDGWGWGPGYAKVPYDTIRNLVKSIQPRCLIVENNHYYQLQNTEIVEYEGPIDGPPKIDNILPAEGCSVIHPGTDYCWFWHPDDECVLKSAQVIVDELNSNNLRNANYLLGITPDTTGLIPQCQVDLMKQIGQLRGLTQ